MKYVSLKSFFLIAALFFASSSQAATPEVCEYPADFLENSSAINPEEMATLQQNAAAFLEQFRTTLDFLIEDASQLAGPLDLLGRNRALPPEKRSELLAAASAIFGRMFQKIPGGDSHDCGRKSYNRLEKSLSLNPRNPFAIYLKVRTMTEIIRSNSPRIISWGLGISLQKESEWSLQQLPALEPTNETASFKSILCGYADRAKECLGPAAR